MTVAEVRKIRKKKSIEWASLSSEKRNLEIKKGAKQIQIQIDEMRQKALRT